jgi:transaldolase/glucose-6-phosphate isomerase
MDTASPASRSEVLTISLPGELGNAIAEAHRKWDSARNTEKLWTDPQHFPLSDLVETQIQDLSKFKALAAEVREDGFSHIVLLAGDDSAVPAEAIHRASRTQSGCLEWLLLDTADPSELRKIEARVNLARTLFCTFHRGEPAPATELLASYFFEKTREVRGDEARLHFIAIAAQSAALEPFGGAVQYRHIYSLEEGTAGPLNPFSDFGLVPLAAAGHGVEKLLKGAAAMAQLCRDRDSRRNPGVALGLLLAAAAPSRDKLTLICSPSCRALGNWVAQLIASDRLPFVCVIDEPVVSTEIYGPVRLFVHLCFSHEINRDVEEHVSQLEDANHPLLRLVIEDTADLGQTIFQFQMAAAVAAMSLGRSPLQTAKTISQPPQGEREVGSHGDLKLFADLTYAPLILRNGDSAGALLRRHLDRLEPGDLFGVIGFVSGGPEHEGILQTMRKAVLECKQAATIVGFGPGFLAGAGSVLLNGPAAATVLFLTSEQGDSKSAFTEAVSVQARHDFHALAQAGRPVIRVHLGSDVTSALKHLRDLICAAVEH